VTIWTGTIWIDVGFLSDVHSEASCEENRDEQVWVSGKSAPSTSEFHIHLATAHMAEIVHRNGD
jgi:hypothetical protein